MCSFVAKCNCNTSSKRSLKWLYKVVRMRPQPRRCIFCFLLVLRWQYLFVSVNDETSIGVTDNSDLQHFVIPTRKPHTKMERKKIDQIRISKAFGRRMILRSTTIQLRALFVCFFCSLLYSFHNSYRLPIWFFSSMAHYLEMIGLLAGILSSFIWSRFHLKKRMDTTRLTWHLVLSFRAGTGLLCLWGFIEELNRKGL